MALEKENWRFQTQHKMFSANNTNTQRVVQLKLQNFPHADKVTFVDGTITRDHFISTFRKPVKWLCQVLQIVSTLAL